MADLISRVALLNDLSYCAPELWQDEEYIKAKIMKQPAVDAAPVVCAEWVEEPDRQCHYHCSNCGVVWGVSAMAMKYCPNCTAKMTNSPLWDMEDEAATEMAQYCERYEPTYNPEDGSM